MSRRLGILLTSLRIALMPPAMSTSSMWKLLEGETLQIFGHFAEMSFIFSRSYFIPASLARAKAWRTVFVEPPIAISSIKAFFIDFSVIMSSGFMSFSIRVIIWEPAFS